MKDVLAFRMACHAQTCANERIVKTADQKPISKMMKLMEARVMWAMRRMVTTLITNDILSTQIFV